MSGSVAAPVTLSSVLPEIDVDAFVSSADGHAGADYCYAVNQAVAAVPNGTKATIRASSGSHTVWTTCNITKSIHMLWNGAVLNPQSGGAAGVWGATPLSLSGCTLTGGSTVVTCASTAGVVANMVVGGTGVPAGDYINCAGTWSGASCNASSTQFTLALPARLDLVCSTTAGSTAVRGCNYMTGIASGQTISGVGVPAGTTISGLHYGGSSATDTQGFTLSAAATSSAIPDYLTVTSSWSSALVAERVAPVVDWIGTSAGMENPSSQMINAGESDLTITDTGWRTLTGVIGERVNGIDQFVSTNLRVNNLLGSALVIGGVTPSNALSGVVRESFWHTPQLRDSGEHFTGQASFMLMTGGVGCPNNCPTSDEINQIGFTGAQAVFPFSAALVVGTYNATHTGTNGPRQWYFSDNTQFEGGQEFMTYSGNEGISAPDDLITIYQAANYGFHSSELAAPGYGRFIVRSYNSGGTNYFNSSYLWATSKPVTYTVSSTGGSSTITWVSGGRGGFNPTGIWNGQAAELNDGGSCTPCNVYLAPTGAVNSAGTVMTLAAPLYGGTTNPSATLTVGLTGYYTYFPGSPTVDFLSNGYGDPAYFGVLGMTAPAQAWVNTLSNQDDYNGVTTWESSSSTGNLNPFNFLAPNTFTGSSMSVGFGVAPSTNNMGLLVLNNFGAGSASNYLQLQMAGTSKGGLNINGAGKVYTANNILDDGSGNLAATTVTVNGTKMSNAPVMMWSTAGCALSASGIECAKIQAYAAMTFKQISVLVTGTGTCTTYPIVGLYDQTNSLAGPSVTTNSASAPAFLSSSSGSLNVAAGDAVIIGVLNGPTCTTPPTVSVTSQYIMQ